MTKDDVLSALHELVGKCGHCGNRSCLGRRSHSKLPDKIATDDVFKALDEAVRAANKRRKCAKATKWIKDAEAVDGLTCVTCGATWGRHKEAPLLDHDFSDPRQVARGQAAENAKEDQLIKGHASVPKGTSAVPGAPDRTAAPADQSGAPVPGELGGAA